MAGYAFVAANEVSIIATVIISHYTRMIKLRKTIVFIYIQLHL